MTENVLFLVSASRERHVMPVSHLSVTKNTSNNKSGKGLTGKGLIVRFDSDDL